VAARVAAVILEETTMTIANVTLAVLIFFGCEAVFLLAVWKRARHETAAREPQSAQPRLLAK
jgi:hypothetical protein